MVPITVKRGYRRDVPSRNAPRDLRASDADRERIMSVLAEAVSDGRLTVEEHAERLEQAAAARTLGDLVGLTSDLVTSDAQPLRLDGTRPVTAVFGGQRREGRWVVPERLAVAAVFGEALLDFREALLQSSRVIVYATVICGRLKILVPDGVTVEVTGTSVASSRRGPVTRGQSELGGWPGRAARAGRGGVRRAVGPGGRDGPGRPGRPGRRGGGARRAGATGDRGPRADHGRPGAGGRAAEGARIPGHLPPPRPVIQRPVMLRPVMLGPVMLGPVMLGPVMLGPVIQHSGESKLTEL